MGNWGRADTCFIREHSALNANDNHTNHTASDTLWTKGAGDDGIHRKWQRFSVHEDYHQGTDAIKNRHKRNQFTGDSRNTFNAANDH